MKKTGMNRINIRKIIFYLIYIIITGILFVYCNDEDSGELIDIAPNSDGYYVDDTYNWPAAIPAAQGLNADLLSVGIEQAKNTEYMYSLLIVRNGYLILEEYFNGQLKNMANVIESASKSYTSALIGISLDKGFIDSTEQKMIDFFPEYENLLSDYQEKNDITLKHLLMMRSGFPFDLDYDCLDHLSNSDDWIEFGFKLDLEAVPGEKWAYASISSHILSAIITKASGKSTLDFAQEYLFDPLKITIARWQTDPKGYNTGGWGIFMTPRDMARFGFLFLNKGKIEGKRVVSEEWINESIKGYSVCTWPSGSFHNLMYGYQWWSASSCGHNLYMAQGRGGQNIVIIPDLNMVVVTTTDSSLDMEQSWTQSRKTFDFISEYVISAVEYH